MKSFVCFVISILLLAVGSIPALAESNHTPLDVSTASHSAFTPSAITSVDYNAQKLFSPDAGNRFYGYSIAVSGDTAIIGSPLDQVGSNVNQGSAYVYVRQGTKWVFQARLLAQMGDDNDFLGISVAIDGDTALVGANGQVVNNNPYQGSAFLFTRIGSTWTQVTELTASDGAASDRFGESVALSGDYAVIGAPGRMNYNGAAYFFQRTADGWVQDQVITRDQPTVGDQLGRSVAIDGDLALVGAPYSDPGPIDQGSILIVRHNVSWEIEKDLNDLSGSGSNLYGNSVAVDGNLIVVGAPGHPVEPEDYSGTAFIYQSIAGDWVLQQMIYADDHAGGDAFGISVAVEGKRVVVGAPFHHVGGMDDQGLAYIFTPGASAWEQRSELMSADGASADYVGWAVTVSGASVLVGANHADIGGNLDQGAVYIFTVPGLYLPLVRK